MTCRSLLRREFVLAGSFVLLHLLFQHAAVSRLAQRTARCNCLSVLLLNVFSDFRSRGKFHIWTTLFAEVAQALSSDQDLVPCAVAVLRTVNDICAKGSDRGMDMNDTLEGIISPITGFLERSIPMYENLIVNAEEGGIDEEDDSGLQGLVCWWKGNRMATISASCLTGKF